MIPGENITTGAPAKCDECGETPPMRVLRSMAGYYIGTACSCGPYSRESEYYKTKEAAQKDLDAGTFGR